MWRFLLLSLIVATMMSFTWAFEDYYDGPTQKNDHQQNFGRGQHHDHTGNVHARHTHAHTRDVPKFQNLNNGPTTDKNYIESSPTNTDIYFNSTENRVKSNNKRKSQEDANGMVYPPDLEGLSAVTNQVKSRSCSYGLCDEVDNYPLEKIERILRESELRKFFTTVKFENRFGDVEDGDNLCATIKHTRFPKTAKNIQDKEQVIVNVDQYKQGVEFETCREEGPCNFAENFPNNFTPKCVQRYTVRKLMIVGKESDDTVFDYFKIPSCCVCMVKK